jgi:hypothetical protein
MTDQPTIIVPQFHYGLPDIYDVTPWSADDIADLSAAIEHGAHRGKQPGIWSTRKSGESGWLIAGSPACRTDKPSSPRLS